MTTYADIWADIRAALRTERHAQGLSQRELAERIGVAESTLANWENGSQEPVASNLVTWAGALGSTIRLGDHDDYRRGWLDALQDYINAGKQLLAAKPWETR